MCVEWESVCVGGDCTRMLKSGVPICTFPATYWEFFVLPSLQDEGLGDVAL